MRISSTVLFILSLTSTTSHAAVGHSWQFAVSGDSRNCGDVVMPSIAADVLQSKARFYWHLGDFRLGGKHIDEDILADKENPNPPTELQSYSSMMWRDFLDRQIAPFGLLPVFLSIGNHELILKKRDDFVKTFQPWLDAPPVHHARLLDGEENQPVRPYYHWVEKGIDFLSLDNGSYEQFDQEQSAWITKHLEADEADPAIKAIVVGMHEALPDSIAFGHSMSESGKATAVDSGRAIYAKLLHVQNVAKKHVYVLASHSHFYLDGLFNTEYWHEHGGVLAGWLVGTAGAVRYPLPPRHERARRAITHVYGYLMGTAHADGRIDFVFHQVTRSEVQPEVLRRYGSEFVKFCFDKNSQKEQPH